MSEEQSLPEVQVFLLSTSQVSILLARGFFFKIQVYGTSVCVRALSPFPLCVSVSLCVCVCVVTKREYSDSQTISSGRPYRLFLLFLHCCHFMMKFVGL